MYISGHIISCLKSTEHTLYCIFLQLVAETESSKSIMSLESSTHSLLSQALSLQDPQQKADVMQKLRVLQVYTNTDILRGVEFISA